MVRRKIIEIDREKCDGCGLCTEACAEGALVLDEEDKAVLAKEIYCDGMGACLDICPTGALKIVERESENYDPQETYHHVLKTRGKDAAKNVHGIDDGDDAQEEKETAACVLSVQNFHHGGCPGSMAREIKRAPSEDLVPGASELSQWPVQLHLVSPYAPYLKECDLLVAADCTAFALGGFHQELLRGKKLVIACPKLDDTSNYVAKLAEIIKHNDIRSLTVAIMVVPCCSGLFQMVSQAVEESGVKLDLKKVVVGIDGQIVSEARDMRLKTRDHRL